MNAVIQGYLSAFDDVVRAIDQDAFVRVVEQRIQSNPLSHATPPPRCSARDFRVSWLADFDSSAEMTSR